MEVSEEDSEGLRRRKRRCGKVDVNSQGRGKSVAFLSLVISCISLASRYLLFFFRCIYTWIFCDAKMTTQHNSAQGFSFFLFSRIKTPLSSRFLRRPFSFLSLFLSLLLLSTSRLLNKSTSSSSPLSLSSFFCVCPVQGISTDFTSSRSLSASLFLSPSSSSTFQASRVSSSSLSSLHSSSSSFSVRDLLPLSHVYHLPSSSSSSSRKQISSKHLSPSLRCSSFHLSPNSGVCTPAFLSSPLITPLSTRRHTSFILKSLSSVLSTKHAFTRSLSKASSSSSFPTNFSPSFSFLNRRNFSCYIPSLRSLPLFSSSSSSSSDSSLSRSPLLRDLLTHLFFSPSSSSSPSPEDSSSTSSSTSCLSSFSSKCMKFFYRLLPSSSSRNQTRSLESAEKKGKFSSATFYRFTSTNEEALKGKGGVFYHLLKAKTCLLTKIHHLWSVCTLHWGETFSHTRVYLQEVRVMIRPLLHLLILHHKPLFFASSLLIRFFKILLYLRYLLDWLPQVNPYLLPFSFIYRATDVYINLFT
ncbi:yggt family protein, partial [Cystoisospora suis]